MNIEFKEDIKKWDFLDTIQCIHLPHRKDRMVFIQELKKKIHIPIKIYNAVKSEEGAIKGCFESHQNIMKSALKSGFSNALIFEDDAEISSHFSFEKIDEVKQFMHHGNYNWDIIYLGCFPDVWKYSQHYVSGNLYKVKATQTHAYIVNKPYMEFFVNLHFEGIPIDEVFLKTSKAYAVLPTLFQQSLSQSDVSSIQISNLPFKNSITTFIEYYSIYFGKFPISYVCFFLLIVLVIVRCKKKYN